MAYAALTLPNQGTWLPCRSRQLRVELIRVFQHDATTAMVCLLPTARDSSVVARFGYIPDIKVGKRILLYFWLKTVIYHKNLAIRKISPKIWQL
jgi:hypothetical protein